MRCATLGCEMQPLRGWFLVILCSLVIGHSSFLHAEGAKLRTLSGNSLEGALAVINDKRVQNAELVDEPRIAFGMRVGAVMSRQIQVPAYSVGPTVMAARWSSGRRT